jgi:type 1 fimbriae regulatory protein FimB/type 1 fimbriae regulatory protein FimE
LTVETGLVQVTRLKNGLSSTHPIRGTELRAAERLSGLAVFICHRAQGTDDAGDGAQDHHARRLARQVPLPIHPHMLRHSAGYKFANDGQDTRAIQQYLGHRNITHTVCYTELSPDRFKSFWKD